MRNLYDDENDQDDNSYSGRAYSEAKQLRVSDIIYALRKRIVFIMLVTFIGLITGIILSVISYLRGEMSKQYTITSSIAVAAQTGNGLFTTQGQNPNSTDIYLAENMVDSVIYVMKSDKLMNKVMEEIQILGVSVKDITNNLKLEQYNKTQIIEMTLYWRSAQEGTQILAAIMKTAPKILLETLKVGNVTVVNEPTAKYVIGGSLSAAMWVYMALFGLMAGCGIAVLELLLYPTLLNTKDAERDLALDVLAEVPYSKPFFHKKHNLLMMCEQENSSAIIDNYQSLAHIVRRYLKKRNYSCVYVTSALPGEGKTTVTAYLAVALADLGMKVLAIDFDTKNPKLGGLFLKRVDYNHSLNALYHGDITKEEAITSLTGNLDLLPAVLERNSLPIDESILGMVHSFRNDYDVILMDTAPVGRVANTMSLNELADVALFVIRFDGTGMEQIRESLIRLDKSGTPLMGCVINSVKKVNLNNALGKNDERVYGYPDAKRETEDERNNKKHRFRKRKEKQKETTDSKSNKKVKEE